MQFLVCSIQYWLCVFVDKLSDLGFQGGEVMLDRVIRYLQVETLVLWTRCLYLLLQVGNHLVVLILLSLEILLQLLASLLQLEFLCLKSPDLVLVLCMVLSVRTYSAIRGML